MDPEKLGGRVDTLCPSLDPDLITKDPDVMKKRYDLADTTIA